MPRSAIENVDVDYCLPLADIAPLLVRLTTIPAVEDAVYPIPEMLEIENKIAWAEKSEMEDVEKLGKLSAFTCPECRGALWEIQDGNLLRFRCHVGHAFSVESLLADQSGALENALWAALRSLEENAALSRRMADRARESNRQISIMQYEENAREVEQHAAVIRQILRNNEKISKES
jgi:two-component system chemotaxis response regulator CheB